jgi:hypothetical protein
MTFEFGLRILEATFLGVQDHSRPLSINSRDIPAIRSASEALASAIVMSSIVMGTPDSVYPDLFSESRPGVVDSLARDRACSTAFGDCMPITLKVQILSRIAGDLRFDDVLAPELVPAGVTFAAELES